MESYVRGPSSVSSRPAISEPPMVTRLCSWALAAWKEREAGYPSLTPCRTGDGALKESGAQLLWILRGWDLASRDSLTWDGAC